MRFVLLRDYEVSISTPDGKERVHHVRAESEDAALIQVAHRIDVPVETLRSRILDVRIMD